jgi:type II secretory pathway pseudopilin PulG
MAVEDEMNSMKRFHPPASDERAMTRTELIVVLALLAILIGLFVPQAARNADIQRMARKVRAMTDLANTVAAVKQYYTEYGEYPLAGPNSKGDITFGDAASGAASPVSNEALYNILRNYPGMDRPTPDRNPRQIVFFEGKDAIGTSGHPRFGFATSSTGGTGTLGAFYDPWGNQYAIVVDADHDGYVKVPYLDVMKESPNGLHSGCAGWSPGKDGNLGKEGDKMLKDAKGSRSDDVVSWE